MIKRFDCPKCDLHKLLAFFESQNLSGKKLRKTTKKWVYTVNPWTRPFSVRAFRRNSFDLDGITIARFEVVDNKFILVDDLIEMKSYE